MSSQAWARRGPVESRSAFDAMPRPCQYSCKGYPSDSLSYERSRIETKISFEHILPKIVEFPRIEKDTTCSEVKGILRVRSSWTRSNSLRGSRALYLIPVQRCESRGQECFAYLPCFQTGCEYYSRVPKYVSTFRGTSGACWKLDSS